MSGNLYSRLCRLLDDVADIVGRVRIRLAVDDNLDNVRSVIDVFADRLAKFVARICEEVLGIIEDRLIGSRSELSSEWRDDPAGHDHRRPAGSSRHSEDSSEREPN